MVPNRTPRRVLTGPIHCGDTDSHCAVLVIESLDRVHVGDTGRGTRLHRAYVYFVPYHAVTCPRTCARARAHRDLHCVLCMCVFESRRRRGGQPLRIRTRASTVTWSGSSKAFCSIWTFVFQKKLRLFILTIQAPTCSLLLS